MKIREWGNGTAQRGSALLLAIVATIVDILFTTDRQWGAPLADGGSGGTAS